jgi:adhesin transport system outer membrane protein
MANNACASWSDLGRPASAVVVGAVVVGAVMVAALPWVTTAAAGASLEDSIRATLATNPEIGVVRADREAIDQELRQARADYLPSIDLRGAVGPEYTNSPSTRNRRAKQEDPSRDSATTLSRYESQVTLSQMLFDGFATQSEVERQLARVDSAAYRVQEAAEFIALDAVEAHLDVLRNLQLNDLTAENLTEHQRILARVSEVERGGAGSIADVRQTESRVAEARSSLASATGNLRDAGARYQRVVGATAESLIEPQPPVHALPESQEAAALRAADNRPTVLIANADIDAARAELEGSRAGYYPRFDIELGAAANRNLDGVKGGDVDAQAMFVVRYNLFRGGADVAREREAFARVGESRETLREARRAAEEEARVSYNALETARARVEALRQGVEAQRATRDIYAQQFDLGQRSLLDLLDAENELFIDRANLITALYTGKFAVYRVLTVTGDLLMTLDIDRPKEEIDIYRPRQRAVQEPVPATPASP